MRRTIIFLVMVIGMLTLLTQTVLAGTWENDTNIDFVDERMTRGNDYTRTWTAQGYNAWSGDSDWGGWYWAANYIAPCPQWQKVNAEGEQSVYGGKCPWEPDQPYEPTIDPQTVYGHSDDLYEGTILDDLYARVLDHWNGMFDDTETGWKGILDQDLDILFGRYDDATTNRKYVFDDPDYGDTTLNTFIDESIDQVLAYWDETSTAGDPNATFSYLSPNTENGIFQRLVGDFQLSLTLSGDPDLASDVASVSSGYFKEVYYIDQWVVQWLRDITTAAGMAANSGYPDGYQHEEREDALGGGKQGIEQYYSSWFEYGTPITGCPTGLSCGHTYDLGHKQISKKVEKGTHNVGVPTTKEYDYVGSKLEWDP